jgi:plasmid stabilization system protein ParE
LNDLAEIIGHISEDDAESASRFGTTLLDHLDLLPRFPRMGAVIAERPTVRKLSHSPIVVYYRIHEAKQLIEILHLRHGSRRPPKSFSARDKR